KLEKCLVSQQQQQRRQLQPDILKPPLQSLTNKKINKLLALQEPQATMATLLAQRLEETTAGEDDWSDEEEEDLNEDYDTRTYNLETRDSLMNASNSSEQEDEEEEEEEGESSTNENETPAVVMSIFFCLQSNRSDDDEEDDDDEQNTLGGSLLSAFQPHDLSTPTKKLPSLTRTSGFLVNMEIDEDDDVEGEEESEDIESNGEKIQKTKKKFEENQQTENPLDKKYSPDSAESQSNSQAGSLPSEMEMEIYDCQDVGGSERKRLRHSDDDEDYGSSNGSDILSDTGSVKNMADFDDQSENDDKPSSTQTQSMITPGAVSQPQGTAMIVNKKHQPQQRKKRQTSETSHSSQSSSGGSSSISSTSTNSDADSSRNEEEIILSQLSKPGQTLLWDLLLEQDKALRLQDPLLQEAERLFGHLLISCEDKRIVLHFIIASLENLKKSSSSLVSLRLLPKLFSFLQQQHNRPSQSVFTLFNDKYHILNAFFNDLQQLARKIREQQQSPANGIPVSIQTEVEVRLHFLTCIFSSSATPKEFHLNQIQATVLWDCLTVIMASASSSSSTCREDLYTWLLNQLKNRDGGHALSLDTFKHLLSEKLITLNPEYACCQQLTLIQDILQQYRIHCCASFQHQQQHEPQQLFQVQQQYNEFHMFELVILNYISDVAMKAYDQNVSTLAAQLLNMYQIQNEDGTLEREEQFINRCMTCLKQICDGDETAQKALSENKLRMITRITVLLRTHLDLFMKRYSFVIRMYLIFNEQQQQQQGLTFADKSIHCQQQMLKSHLKYIDEHQYQAQQRNDCLKLICNSTLAGNQAPDKIILKMSPTEYLGDLRAELTRWYLSIKQTILTTTTTLATVEKATNEDRTTNVLPPPPQRQTTYDTHIRIVTNGQELDRDMDEKTLAECNLKDNQVIIVSSTPRIRMKDPYIIEERLLRDFIPHKMPMIILLRDNYFDQFFHILAQLQSLIESSADHTEARYLAHRIWDIILLIPTNSRLLEKFEQLHLFDKEQWPVYFNRNDPYRLTYSLQIIDMLIRKNPIITSDGSNVPYRDLFVQKGGLKYFYEILISKCLLPMNDNNWCQGLPEALYRLLHVLSQHLFKPQRTISQPTPPGAPPPPSLTILTTSGTAEATCGEQSSKKKLRRENGSTPAIVAALTLQDSTTEQSQQQNHPQSSSLQQQQQQQYPISEPHSENISMIDKDLLLRCLIDLQLLIVNKTTVSRVICPCMYFFFTNQTEILHQSMALLIPLCHYYESIRCQFLKYEQLKPWLKTLLLDAHEPMLRREAALCIFRLIIAPTLQASTNSSNQIIPLNPFLISNDTPPPLQRSLHDEKTLASSYVAPISLPSCDNPPERVCLLPILTSLLELLPYTLKFLLNDLISYVPMSSSLNISFSSLISQLPSPVSSQSTTKTTLHDLPQHCPLVLQSCHEYFLLLTWIIDHMHFDEIKSVKITIDEHHVDVNFNQLVELLMTYIHQRLPYESYREKIAEDDVLYGLLCLLSSIIKQTNSHLNKFTTLWPNSNYNQMTLLLVEQIYNYLFELPTNEQRNVPKCKSHITRRVCYELLVELVRLNKDNFIFLQKKLCEQHHCKTQHLPYQWEYWPRDDGRAYCGYVGLTNLGATCYMATSMQHLYMIPELRSAILKTTNNNSTSDKKHEQILYELKRMFAYLLESERKSYNPKTFCKVYTMAHQPLNTGDQKDMTEFFTDLITKLEEMSDELKTLVRELFCGILTNIVLSFDCPHLSRKLEEFYTVRCQVADMKDLYESLNEMTVKDTLEGDNMYTCSKCAKKVRAEKRVCFRKLPKILCLNTMRYTFNMVTMQREKVNTHFSFPMQLDMSGYMEKNLIDPNKLVADDDENSSNDDSIQNESMNMSTTTTTNKSVNEGSESSLFELIGVTVHTGTAEGGHYYSFIRDRVKRQTTTTNNVTDEQSQSQQQHDSQPRWYLFNDADVKSFDPNQIANECFGGEITSKGYDQAQDRFLDFQFEKTHSAYMLFYERVDHVPSTMQVDSIAHGQQLQVQQIDTTNSSLTISTLLLKDNQTYSIPADIVEWIWEDNRRFVRDRHLFDHHYFTFMWRICHQAMNTIIKEQDQSSFSLLPIQLAITFVFETYIHAKEKPTMLNWVEYLSKQFTASKPAAVWFLSHMTNDDTWLIKVLVKCPNHTIRQMFERVLLDVLHKLRPSSDSQNDRSADSSTIVVQKFLRKYLSILSDGIRLPIRYMCEYFAFLHDFAHNGCDECYLLLDCLCIKQLVTFYMLHRRQQKSSQQNLVGNDDQSNSEDEQNPTISQTNNNTSNCCIDDDVIPLNEHPTTRLNRPAIFEKMFPLIVLLLEAARLRTQPTSSSSPSSLSQQQLQSYELNEADILALTGTDVDFQFIQQQILDNINLKSTASIIQLICYNKQVLANKLCNLLCTWIQKYQQDTNHLQAFFKIFTYLIEQHPPTTTTTTTTNDTSNNTKSECDDQSQSQPLVLPDLSWTDFSTLIVHHTNKLIEICAVQVFDWLNTVIPKSSFIQQWVLNNIRPWLKPYLLYCHQTRTRTLIAQLLITLVPSQTFRQTYRPAKYYQTLSRQQSPPTTITSTGSNSGAITSLLNIQTTSTTTTISNTSLTHLFDSQQYQQYPGDFTQETHDIIKQLELYLLDLIDDINQEQLHDHHHIFDSQQRLTQYISCLIHFTRYPNEKLLTKDYIHPLCTLILSSKLTEDHNINNSNKLILFILLHQLCTSSDNNTLIITTILNTHPEFKQQLPQYLIVVDHEDQELVVYNRLFLYIYYSLLREFCQTSREYTKYLAQHKNLMWALRNVLPNVHLYQNACEELVNIVKLICKNQSQIKLDSSLTVNTLQSIDNVDERVVFEFKKELYQLLFRQFEVRICWSTILDLLKDICLETTSHEEYYQIIIRRGLSTLSSIFSILYQYYHEQCSPLTQHLSFQTDLIQLLILFCHLLDTCKYYTDQKQQTTYIRSLKEALEQWKEKMDLLTKLLQLLNSFNTTDLRQKAFDVIKKLIVTLNIQDLTMICTHIKVIHEQSSIQHQQQLGPYFPRRNIKQQTLPQQRQIFRPHFGIYFKTQLLETSKGRDLDFDRSVHSYYSPYHNLIDNIARLAYNQDALNGSIMNLLTLVACEGAYMHFTFFPILFLEIYESTKTSARLIIQEILQTSSSYYFHRYIEIVLIDERISLFQNEIYRFLVIYLPLILTSTTTTNTSTNTSGDEQISLFVQRLQQLLTKTIDICLQSITNEIQTNLDFVQHFTLIDYSHKQIIGDIKALELCLHCNFSNDKIKEIIEENIHSIKQKLASSIINDDGITSENDVQDTGSTSNDDDNISTPIKKRRLDDNADGTTSVIECLFKPINNSSSIIENTDLKRKAITDALQVLETFLAQLSVVKQSPIISPTV
ncbi:unnamed protein product, partial [Didymodactylos carnosus]